jgi:hypothetical protein
LPNSRTTAAFIIFAMKYFLLIHMINVKLRRVVPLRI